MLRCRCRADAAPADEIRRVVNVFRELRSGQSEDGRIKFKTPSGTMSTAEAISVIVQGMSMAVHLGDGRVRFDDLLAGIEGDGRPRSRARRDRVARVPRLARHPLTWPIGVAPMRRVVRLLGIRHHGPGSARAVRACLARRAARHRAHRGPADGRRDRAAGRPPRDAAPGGDARATSLDHPERAVFHPFASFSPEWVALTWALRRRRAGPVHRPAACTTCCAGVRRAAAAVDAPIAGRPIDPLAELAAAAGYDDAERWWEDVVEHRVAPTARSTPMRRSPPSPTR